MKKQRLAFIIIALVSLSPYISAEEQHIDMEALSIIGNKELPNVLYILPWKPAHLPDAVELPLSSLINDALQPIDRQTLLRRQYYKKIIKQQSVSHIDTEAQKK